MATKTKVDIVEHKKHQQDECCEWDKMRPENHTAQQHSKDILEVRRKTRVDDGPQINT